MSQPWANANLRDELNRLCGAADLPQQLQAIPTDHLLDLTEEERGKFSQDSHDFLGRLIRELVIRKEYPTSWEGKPLDVLERVQCWGARWHVFQEPLNCRFCGMDLRHPSGPPFKREVGQYHRELDRTVAYQCPDCRGVWIR